MSIIVRNASNGKKYIYDLDDFKIKKKGLSLESVNNTESLSDLTSKKMNIPAPSLKYDTIKSELESIDDNTIGMATDVRYSIKVEDPETLEFLEDQDYITNILT